MIKKMILPKVIIGMAVIMVFGVGCSSTEEAPSEDNNTATVVEKEVEEVDEGLSTEDLVYLNYTTAHSTDLSNQFFELSDLMSARIDSDQWARDVVVTILRIQELADEYIEYRDIPQTFIGVDKEYKKAMQLYSSAMENMPSALDKVFDYGDDSDLLIEMDKIEKGGEHISTATDLILEMSNDY